MKIIFSLAFTASVVLANAATTTRDANLNFDPAVAGGSVVLN